MSPLPTTTIMQERVRAGLASTFAVSASSVADSTSLRDDLGADSLALLDALAELEEQIGAELPDSDEVFAALETVGDVERAFEAALTA